MLLVWGRSSRWLWRERASERALVRTSKPCGGSHLISPQTLLPTRKRHSSSTYVLVTSQILHWDSRRVLREETVSGSVPEKLESRSIKGRPRKRVKCQAVEPFTSRPPGTGATDCGLQGSPTGAPESREVTPKDENIYPVLTREFHQNATW